MKHLQITEVMGLFNFWQHFFYTNSEAQIKNHEKYIVYYSGNINYWMAFRSILLECYRIDTYINSSGNNSLITGYHQKGLDTNS
jgi:hypothetical protein